MNAKHQFKYTYNEGCEDFSPVEVTFDMPGDVTINQMLWNFECYLKSCGFVFDGHLEMVSEDTCAVQEETHGCCMGDWDCNEESEEYKSEKLKEWSEGLAKLEAEIRAKRESELKKNKWVHGICNPPSPDWVSEKNNPDNCWNS